MTCQYFFTTLNQFITIKYRRRYIYIYRYKYIQNIKSVKSSYVCGKKATLDAFPRWNPILSIWARKKPGLLLPLHRINFRSFHLIVKACLICSSINYLFTLLLHSKPTVTVYWLYVFHFTFNDVVLVLRQGLICLYILICLYVNFYCERFLLQNDRWTKEWITKEREYKIGTVTATQTTDNSAMAFSHRSFIRFHLESPLKHLLTF